MVTILQRINDLKKGGGVLARSTAVLSAWKSNSESVVDLLRLIATLKKKRIG